MHAVHRSLIPLGLQPVGMYIVEPFRILSLEFQILGIENLVLLPEVLSQFQVVIAPRVERPLYHNDRDIRVGFANGAYETAGECVALSLGAVRHRVYDEGHHILHRCQQIGHRGIELGLAGVSGIHAFHVEFPLNDVGRAHSRTRCASSLHYAAAVEYQLPSVAAR